MLEGVLEFFKAVNIVVLLDNVLGPGFGGLASWLIFIGCVFMGLTLAGLFVFGKEMFKVMMARVHNNMIGEIPLKTGKKIMVEIPRRSETFRMTFGSGETAVEKEWKILPDSFRAYESGVWYTILSPDLPNSISQDQLILNTINNSVDGVITPDEVESAGKINARRMALRMLMDDGKILKYGVIIGIVGIICLAIVYLAINATCPAITINGGVVTTVAKNATSLV